MPNKTPDMEHQAEHLIRSLKAAGVRMCTWRCVFMWVCRWVSGWVGMCFGGYQCSRTNEVINRLETAVLI